MSCQARPGNPLHGPEPMALMARAAVQGGAAGIRADGAADVASIRAAVEVPIIGIAKAGDRAGVYITPTVQAASAVVRAGADLVATDGTVRPRPDGRTLAEHVAAIHDELAVPVMADVDSVEAGLAARDAGADVVATTLSGYTDGSGGAVPEGTVPEGGAGGPDLELLAALAGKLDCAVVAEGRYVTPDQVGAAFAAGATAVVVGTAITNPAAITRRFAAAVPPASGRARRP